MELGTPSGFRESVTRLPWAGIAQHRPGDLEGSPGTKFISQLIDFAVPRRFTAILAPAHLLRATNDPWMAADQRLVHELREQLDRAGQQSVPIYYPLAITASLFGNADSRQHFKAVLSTLPVDAVWLRIHPFGSRSGPASLRRYVEACRDLHRLGLPLVAERSGTIGVALLAFGAVGGIEGGVTLGEHFSAAGLLREPRKGSAFLPQARVYFPELATFLDRKRANRFLENRSMKSSFACRDTTCCRRGAQDMLANPRRHFLIRRLGEVRRVSETPDSARAQQYMEEILRPATDRIVRASKVEPSLEGNRRRLESWRHVLGAIIATGRPASFSAVPSGRRIAKKREA